MIAIVRITGIAILLRVILSYTTKGDTSDNASSNNRSQFAQQAIALHSVGVQLTVSIFGTWGVSRCRFYGLGFRVIFGGLPWQGV